MKGTTRAAALVAAVFTISGLGLTHLPAQAASPLRVTLEQGDQSKAKPLTAAEKAAITSKANNSKNRLNGGGTITYKYTDPGSRLSGQYSGAKTFSKGVETKRPPDDPPPVNPPPGWPGQAMIPLGNVTPQEPYALDMELNSRSIQTCVNAFRPGFVLQFIDIDHLASCQVTEHWAVVRDASLAIVNQVKVNTVSWHTAMDRGEMSRTTRANTVVLIGTPETSVGLAELDAFNVYVGMRCVLGTNGRSCTVGLNPNGVNETIAQWRADTAGVEYLFASGDGDGWTGLAGDNLSFYGGQMQVGGELMPAARGWRCDYATSLANLAGAPRTGCVMYGTSALMRIRGDDFAVAEQSDHMYFAQTFPNQTWPPMNGGKPKVIPGGFSTTGIPLTRLTDQTKIDRNRSAATDACALKNAPDRNLVAPEWECDEYPFASTYQGARLSAGNFSVRKIHKTDNQEAGKYLVGFYGGWRIIDSDPFWVVASPNTAQP